MRWTCCQVGYDWRGFCSDMILSLSESRKISTYFLYVHENLRIKFSTFLGRIEKYKIVNFTSKIFRYSRCIASQYVRQSL